MLGGGGDYFIVKTSNGTLARADVRVSTNSFYKQMGFKTYDCIDLDGAYNALKFNLNVNLAHVYNFAEQFSLVTNFGTTEHVLNQATCFENIHNLCENNGVMIHGLPIYGYLNHGLFTYSLKFFIRLAVFNGYRFLSANIVEAGYDKNVNLYVRDSEDIDRIDNITTVYQYLNTSKSYDLHYPHTSGGSGFILLIALQKINDDPFSFPLDMPMHTVKSKEILRFFLEDCVNNIHNIAIFGSKNAAKIAYEFMRVNNITIKCFIDDFDEGYIDDIPIISYDKFISEYQKECDCIVKGPLQKGNIENRPGLCVEVVVLEACWFW